MTKREKLDQWFGNLTGVQLERMYPDMLAECEGDFNDFIDDCDEWWESLSVKEKEMQYNHFNY